MLIFQIQTETDEYDQDVAVLLNAEYDTKSLRKKTLLVRVLGVLLLASIVVIVVLVRSLVLCRRAFIRCVHGRPSGSHRARLARRRFPSILQRP